MITPETLTWNEARLFACWIGEMKYTKHQCNDRWYDSENDYDFIGSTLEIYNQFVNHTEWHEFNKENKNNVQK